MRYTEPQDRLFLTMFDDDDSSSTTTTSTNDVESSLMKKQLQPQEGSHSKTSSSSSSSSNIVNNNYSAKFPPKDPSFNKKLLDKKLRDYCWSNRYLRFPWTIDI